MNAPRLPDPSIAPRALRAEATTPSRDVSVDARILELLEAEGIRTLFGIPDPGTQCLFRAATERGFEIVAPHHEQAGGFMADAMARVTGKPAVVFGNQGPGVANLVPAAICAAKEKIPVVFVGEQRSRRLDAQVRRSKFQYVSQAPFFAPAVKYVGVIEFAEQVDEIFHEAFRQALGGTPGPVYIEYPSDHVGKVLSLPAAQAPSRYRVVRQQADPEMIVQAAELIAAARLPIVLAGTAIHTARGHTQLEELTGLLHSPVILTWGGRGALPETHAQVLMYSGAAANEAIAESDLIVAIGTSIGETLHYGTGRHWRAGNPDRRWIQVERDPANVGVNRPVDVPLIGDLRDVLPQLCRELRKRRAFGERPQLALWRGRQSAERRALIDSAPDTKPIHPGRMIVDVCREIPDDAVLVRDGGCTSLWELAYNEIRQRDYLWTSHFGHLGTGLPYAIGAQLACPARRVVLITGDSAFQFHIAELETAVRKHLPIVCVINSDGAWGMEHMGFRNAFGAGRDVEVKWGAVRFDRIAQGYGAYGEYVERTSEIGPAMRRALATGQPAVIQIATDPHTNAFEAPNWAEFVSWYGDYY